MERRCAEQISYSTLRTMPHGGSIPAKLSSAGTFVRVLGGTTEVLLRWATAWRRTVRNDFADPAPGGGLAPTPEDGQAGR
jgi:hypothetical protein